MEKKEKGIRVICLIIIAILICIIVLMGRYILDLKKLANNEGTVNNNVQQEVEENKVEQLDIYSQLVLGLYDYVGVVSDYGKVSMYQIEKTNSQNISNHTKLITAIREALIDEQGKEEIITNKVEIPEYNNQMGLIINGYSEIDGTPEEYVTFANSMTYLDGTIVEQYVKKIFGQDATVTHEDASFIFGEKVMYENGQYKIFQYEGGGGVNWFELSDIVSAEKKGNEIYIYDNYIRRIDEERSLAQEKYYENMTFYADSEEKIKIAEVNENEAEYNTIINEYEWADLSRFDNILGIVLPQYKHTFRQADNGEYYWVSTELVNKADLIAIQ